MDKLTSLFRVKQFVWSFINTGGSQLIGFLGSLVIARVALPSEFGLIAICSSIILICNIVIEAGLASTIVLDKEFSRNKASTILWYTVIVSLMIYILLLTLAGEISKIFGDERLVELIPVMGLSIVGASLGVSHAALAARNFRLKEKAYISLISSMLSTFVGVYIALNLSPLYGLVAITTLTPILLTLGLWIFMPWKVALVLRPKLLASSIKFSIYIALSNLVDQAGKSLITLFLGQRFGLTNLGNYSRAEAVQKIVGQTLDKTIQRVAFPLFSFRGRRKQDEMNLENQIITAGTMLLLFPCVYFIHKFAASIIFVLFGPNWEQIVPILKIVILWPLFILPTSLNYTFLKSLGITEFIFYGRLIFLLSVSFLFLYIDDLDFRFILWGILFIYFLQFIFSSIVLATRNKKHRGKHSLVLFTTIISSVISIGIYEGIFSFTLRSPYLNLPTHLLCILFVSSLISYLSVQILKSIINNTQRIE